MDWDGHQRAVAEVLATMQQAVVGVLVDTHFILHGKHIAIMSLAEGTGQQDGYVEQYRKLAMNIEKLDATVLALHEHLLVHLPVSSRQRPRQDQASMDEHFLVLMTEKVGDSLPKLAADLDSWFHDFAEVTTKQLAITVRWKLALGWKFDSKRFILKMRAKGLRKRIFETTGVLEDLLVKDRNRRHHLASAGYPEGSLPNLSQPNGPLPNDLLPNGPLLNSSLPHGRLPDGRLSDAALPYSPLPQSLSLNNLLPRSRLQDDPVQHGRLSHSRLADDPLPASRVSPLLSKLLQSRGLLPNGLLQNDSLPHGGLADDSSPASRVSPLLSKLLQSRGLLPNNLPPNSHLPHGRLPDDPRPNGHPYSPWLHSTMAVSADPVSADVPSANRAIIPPISTSEVPRSILGKSRATGELSLPQSSSTSSSVDFDLHNLRELSRKPRPPTVDRTDVLPLDEEKSPRPFSRFFRLPLTPRKPRGPDPSAWNTSWRSRSEDSIESPIPGRTRLGNSANLKPIGSLHHPRDAEDPSPSPARLSPPSLQDNDWLYPNSDDIGLPLPESAAPRPLSLEDREWLYSAFDEDQYDQTYDPDVPFRQLSPMPISEAARSYASLP
ncbi:uncharacterized protein PV06_08144 [Exophiala oligosperma]|uniref:Uncharacterized protein n=1 Tax=Exophiala oligosperma TaxID=215243 RepID=A0A0D2BPS6_9EURO|nr:uncharacterized protein PV06_08144 [Exophiala oligosperma]KIW39542.1 hypothetical protein PV06_08144 [Exophiala oligosperma]